MKFSLDACTLCRASFSAHDELVTNALELPRVSRTAIAICETCASGLQPARIGEDPELVGDDTIALHVQFQDIGAEDLGMGPKSRRRGRRK